jgi:RNA polymerase sigma-70 factor (family 1)
MIATMKTPGPHTISGFQQGSKAAFAEVYNMYYSRLYFFIKKLIDDREEAQDITAETFVKLWNLRANFETQQNIKAFLYITARNACLDFLRHQQRQQNNKQEFTYLAMQSDDIALQHDEVQIEVLKQIHSEIENLPTQCRKIFKMAYLERLKNAQIADLLGLTEQTIRNQKTRAIKILRMALINSNVVLALLLVLFLW